MIAIALNKYYLIFIDYEDYDGFVCGSNLKRLNGICLNIEIYRK